MKHRAWMLAGLVLAALTGFAVSHAGEVSESITNPNVAGTGIYYWGGTHWERWTGDGTAPPVSISNLPIGALWYQANAMGPSSLRAAIDRTVNSVKPRDSTTVLETRGARTIGVWLYALPDSGVHTDSTRVALFGVSVKAHLSTAPDSGVAAPVLPVYGGTRSLADTLRQRYIPGGRVVGLLNPYDYIVTGLAAETTDITRTLMPNEQVVPLLSYASFGLGLPRARYFEINAAAFGLEALPPYVSIVVRYLGHSDNWPDVALIRLVTRRMNVRLDAWGLR